MLTRRAFAACTAAGVLLPAAAARAATLRGFADAVAGIEMRVGGRLGVGLVDTATGARAGHRADERFPICSTFKVLAAAAVLTRVEKGTEQLERRVTYKASDLVANSPATRTHVADGMTLAELCAAAITLSDNTAGNLLLGAIGGPAGLTAYARSLGDSVTRLDRTETTLNEAKPGDPHDTTSPAAMANDLQSLVLGHALAPDSRDRLAGWLAANTTGATRIRAGVPKDWRVGDKTGAGEFGTVNDVGVITPPGRAPIVLTVYLTESTAPQDARFAAIADVARAAVAALS